MKHVTFKVREVCQTAGGGSYVVGYTAEVQLTSDTGKIELDIQNTIPADADQELVDAAAKYTRAGFAEVLEPLNCGAVARLSDVLLHPVDFKGAKQQRFSAEHLAAALQNAR